MFYVSLSQHRDFSRKQKKKMDTYSEESIKYIPRAPMLSAKTNTTCREKDTNRRNYRAWQLPSADMLATTTALWQTVSQWVQLNQPRLHMAADDGHCNHNHLPKQLTSVGTMPPPSFLLFTHLTIEAHWPRWLCYSLLMMGAWLLPRDVSWIEPVLCDWGIK